MILNCYIVRDYEYLFRIARVIYFIIKATDIGYHEY